MGPLIKILIGALLLIVPLALYAYDFVTPGPVIQVWKVQLNPLASLWTLIQGGIPPFVMLIGLFVVWLELDEWRIEQELKREEEKAKEEKPQRRGKKKE